MQPQPKYFLTVILEDQTNKDLGYTEPTKYLLYF